VTSAGDVSLDRRWLRSHIRRRLLFQKVRGCSAVNSILTIDLMLLKPYFQGTTSRSGFSCAPICAAFSLGPQPNGIPATSPKPHRPNVLMKLRRAQKIDSGVILRSGVCHLGWTITAIEVIAPILWATREIYNSLAGGRDGINEANLIRSRLG
jgi:hypothetical protein